MTVREKNTAKTGTPIVRRDGDAVVLDIPMSFRRRPAGRRSTPPRRMSRRPTRS